jgi:putative transposase
MAMKRYKAEEIVAKLRLWLADGSCIRLRPQHREHVWSYDFVEDRTHDGRRYRMLNVLDEFTHE